MITPRTTRLVRAADLHSFRSALVTLAVEEAPLDATDRLVVVPTRAAAAQLVRSIEDRLPGDPAAVILPTLTTRAELHHRLFDRVPEAHRRAAPYSTAEREALLAAACRAAIEAGTVPPFRVRPGLVSAMLDFFDSLHRHQKTIDDFERLTLGMLQAGSESDRGADRLIRQTRFFATAFRDFERRCLEAGGLDEAAIRAVVRQTASDSPWRHVIVAVRDWSQDPYGLRPVEWDLLARVPGLDRLDVVVTDRTLAGAFHERIHQWLPGLEETRVEGAIAAPRPTLVVSIGGAPLHTSRDREEEVASFARWVRERVREMDSPVLDRMALVVHKPLPYVYLAREVFRSARIPCQMFDAMPLAGEPFAAALDLLFSFVSANFARVPAIALLRSPHFAFESSDAESIRPGAIAALDAALSEAGYLGDIEVLDRLVGSWTADGSRVSPAACDAARTLRGLARALVPLRSAAPAVEHFDRVLSFLTTHVRAVATDDRDLPSAPESDLSRNRRLRARSAILGIVRALGDAQRRFGGGVVEFEDVAAMVRRGIESHTFVPRSGDSGVHLVDAESARFGEFDCVQLAGLVDGEWPERQRRNIFYSAAILRELGWPSDTDRVDGARASFAELLRLPARQLVASTFSLEYDAIVGPSILVDDIAGAFEQKEERNSSPARIFEYEALGVEPIDVSSAFADARAWAEWRLTAPHRRPGLVVGQAPPRAYSVSALERYQDCPFKFFASDVLRLDELPEDEPSLSPRVRGRFIHEVFQRFFEEWDRRGGGTITSERIDQARAVFVDVAAPLLDRLPDADASLERTRLFGSAISIGIVDVVLGLEAVRPVKVQERWLEYHLEGDFTLNGSDGRSVPLRGVADRIDLMEGKRLRVIDYKSGYAPQSSRALQVPVYALCAQEQLARLRGETWTVDEAAYVVFTGKRSFVPVIKAGRSDPRPLDDARSRLFEIVDGVERGEFQPRPYEPRICTYCAYPTVCRKDYVGDE